MLHPLPNQQRYIIQEDGKVFDLKKNRYKKSSMMKNGSVNIVLKTEENKNHTYLLNKLMWWSFNYETIDRTQVIVHRDGDPSNCAFDNLEVISRKELITKMWEIKKQST